MKKSIVLFVCLFFVLIVRQGSTYAEETMFITAEDTLNILKSYGIMQGNLQYVKSSGTSDNSWKVHLYTTKNQNINFPVIAYVSDKDIVVGILIKNGKVVIPDIPLEELKPTMQVDVSKFRIDKRKIYNPEGKENIFMFSDPDCPFSKNIESQLSTYKGKYKIIVKNFPLEEIHDGAMQRAIEKQCLSINNICDDNARKIAQIIVEEDLKEGLEAGITGTPFFVSAEGVVISGIPDL